MSTKPKVMVAMSGGVDSSLAAALLLEQGYSVCGCYMQLNHPAIIDSDTCEDPAADARRVSEHLGIRLHELDLSDTFGQVIDDFVEQYMLGRTPNPCLRCNMLLKFGRLMTEAQRLGADRLATGHYARIQMHDGRPAIFRAIDSNKDQSYVLFGLPEKTLANVLLPIGELIGKDQTRAMAIERRLPVHDKPDSQDICFVPDGDYVGLLDRCRPNAITPGKAFDCNGQIVGEHRGHQCYTVGQRRGLGIAMGYPAYVVAKNATDNTVTIGDRHAVMCSGLIAEQVNWQAPVELDQPIACQVKVRYNAAPVAARACVEDGRRCRIVFRTPQPAIAPGQAAVCYDNDRLLGGGWIVRGLAPDAVAPATR